MSESQTALIFNLIFASINFPPVRKESAWRNLDTFHGQENSFPSTRRYFQGNSKARRTEIMQKRETGFHDNKNLSSLPIFDGNI